MKPQLRMLQPGNTKATQPKSLFVEDLFVNPKCKQAQRSHISICHNVIKQAVKKIKSFLLCVWTSGHRLESCLRAVKSLYLTKLWMCVFVSHVPTPVLSLYPWAHWDFIKVSFSHRQSRTEHLWWMHRDSNIMPGVLICTGWVTESHIKSWQLITLLTFLTEQ